MKKISFIVALFVATAFIFSACGDSKSLSSAENTTENDSSTEAKLESASSESQENNNETIMEGGDGSTDSIISGSNDSTEGRYAISEAVYPVMAQYPIESGYYDADTGEFDNDSYSADYDAWLASRNQSDSPDDGYDESLSGFYNSLSLELLKNSGTENVVFSPLNIYLALGMLSEITDGESRSQILELLGEESIDSVRARAYSLWEANYRDDGVVTSILANSLWLNKDVDFIQDTMDKLAVIYYASSYQGEMGSDEFDEAFRSWLNEQTGGLLKDQVEGLSLDPETVLALASTLYYKAAWADEFNEEDTFEDTFHAPEGDIECDFMHQSDTMNYFDGDNFSAVFKPLSFSGGMWLILPDEGVSMDEITSVNGVLSQLFKQGDFVGSDEVRVNLSMPKLDVSSDLDLIDSLKSLGITDIFDSELADFSPALSAANGELCVGSATHAARLTADEKGIEAAAYTVVAVAETSMGPPEEIDFTLDRPFIFVVTAEDGASLFVGLVNQV